MPLSLQLDLSYNQLCGIDLNGHGTYTAEGIQAIANALKGNGSLTTLIIYSNNLGDEGVGSIASALTESTASQLESIDLRNNNIGSKGAESLAAWLAVTGSLTSIDLSDNALFPNGEVPSSSLIGDSLETGAKVRMNEVYDGELTVLKEANDEGNVHIGDPTGIQAIADALRVTGSLTSVSLLGNKFDVETASMLLKIKEEKPSLRTLCGLTHEETELKYIDSDLGPADAMLLAPEISVMGSLTEVPAF